MSARALEQFAAQAQRAAGVRGEVDVLITSNAHMRKLNRGFRGKNTVTDVLSFSSASGTAGDIAISAEVGERNARRLGHSAADEMKILVLHGLLHLAGYDHETDGGAMARKEARLRRALGLPAALIERSTPADGKIHHGGAEARRNSLPNSSVSQCLRGWRSARRA
ncbi:MAG TPA: rRNA maturation RNase YbeY [Terriglobales bacterium]|nr:rRNA maturation RNase YbeY [Terriglobales bacterium]